MMVRYWCYLAVGVACMRHQAAFVCSLLLDPHAKIHRLSSDLVTGAGRLVPQISAKSVLELSHIKQETTTRSAGYEHLPDGLEKLINGYWQGTKFLQEQNFAAAEIVLSDLCYNPERKAADLLPDDELAALWYSLGVSQENLNKISAALDSYFVAIRKDAEHFESRYNAARILGMVGQHQVAIDFYNEVQRIRPDFEPAFNNKCREISMLRNATRGLIPVNDTHFGRGEDLSDPDGRDIETFTMRQTIECYEAMQKNFPNSSGAHSNLGVALMRSGRIIDNKQFPAAEYHLRMGSMLDPEQPENWYSLSVLLQDFGGSRLSSNSNLSLAQNLSDEQEMLAIAQSRYLMRIDETQQDTEKVIGTDNSLQRGQSISVSNTVPAVRRKKLTAAGERLCLHRAATTLEHSNLSRINFEENDSKSRFREVKPGTIDVGNEIMLEEAHFQWGQAVLARFDQVETHGTERDAWLYHPSSCTFYVLTHGHHIPMHRGLIVSDDTVKIDKAVSILQMSMNNYYHFVFECLSKLYLARDFLQENHDLKLIVPSHFSSLSQSSKDSVATSKRYLLDEALTLFGLQHLVEQGRVVLYTTGYVIEVKELYAPYWERTRALSYVAPGQKNAEVYLPPRRVLRRLRAQYAPVNLPFALRNMVIWVSRKHDRPNRRAYNEQEVEAAIRTAVATSKTPHNLELRVFDGSKMSLEQTVNLFQRAVIVISVHGAGLANTLYSAPGTHVIEIVLPEGKHRMFYLHSSVALGLKYTAVKGIPYGQFNAMINVPIGPLQSALDAVLTDLSTS